MSNKSYVKLTVPFISKSYYSSKTNCFKAKGTCNFIIYLKDRAIVKQYIQFEESTYRATDFKMVNTVGFWKKKKEMRIFRERFLNADKLFNETRFLSLSNNELKKINEFLKLESRSTVLEQLSYLSGSNPSGSETSFNATPLRCIDKNFLSFNFYNPLKKYRSKKHQFESNLDLENIETIGLVDVVNSNVYLDNFKDEFCKYNFMYINLIEKENPKDRLNKVMSLLEENRIKKNRVESSFNDKVEEIYNLFKNGFYNGNSNYKNQLRSIYNSWTSYLISINKIKNISQNEYISHETIETAHIIGFSYLVNRSNLKDWKLAVNGNNAIFIDANTHTLFDKNLITFNPYNRRIVIKEDLPDKELIEKCISLKEDFLINELNEEQIKNLEINFNYWKQHNKNIN